MEKYKTNVIVLKEKPEDIEIFTNEGAEKELENLIKTKIEENIPILFDLSKISEGELKKQYVKFKDIINNNKKF